MKTAAIVRCYYLNDFLPMVLDSLKDVDEIIIPIVPFHNVTPAQDDTPEIVEKCNNSNVILYFPSIKYNKQHEIFNSCIDLLIDADYIWIIDSDEIILLQDRNKIINYVIKHDNDAAFCKVINYSGIDMIYKERSHQPIVLLKRGAAKFYRGRCIRPENPNYFNDIYMHHLGYLYPPEKMNWKKNNYWNPGNPQDCADMLKRGTKFFNMPKFIKKYLKSIQ